MDYPNTDPRFFGLWSVRQLQVECARLNGVLVGIQEGLSAPDLGESEDRGDDSGKSENTDHFEVK